MQMANAAEFVMTIITSKKNADYHDLGDTPAWPGTITMVYAK